MASQIKVNWGTSSNTFQWDTNNCTSASSTDMERWVVDHFKQSTGGNPGCNESLKHSNAQKGVFHAMKGAVRQVYATDEGHAVEDVGQYDDALRMAGHAGRAYLTTEGRNYDPDESEPYLDDEFDPDNRPRIDVIRDALRRAWSKVDGGNHVGGARIAVSVADHYLEGFETP